MKLDFSAVERTATAPGVLREAVVKISTADATFRESMIRVCLQPRPRWLPNRVWIWLLKRILRIEEHRLRC